MLVGRVRLCLVRSKVNHEAETMNTANSIKTLATLLFLGTARTVLIVHSRDEGG